MDSMIIKLDYAIPVPSIVPDQTTYTTELVLKRKITLFDLMRAAIHPSMDTGTQLKRILRVLIIGNVPDSSLDALDIRDLGKLGEAISVIMSAK